jgi:2,3,4,5-tetrahydropyridine-2-carboxylate N-succinyltransferase
MSELQSKIEAAFSDRSLLEKPEYSRAVEEALELLDRGEARIAEERQGEWLVHEWLQKSVLLYFSIARMQVMELGPFEFYDKIPIKRGLAAARVRVVPPGTVRYGAFCEPGVVVMPGYVNIGARVGAGSMVDTWATVGSCAQIGAEVH